MNAALISLVPLMAGLLHGDALDAGELAPLQEAAAEEASAVERAWLSSLTTPLTLGFVSTDQSLQGEDFLRATKTALFRANLDHELGSEASYQPEAAREARDDGALVTFEAWDNEEQAAAHAAGVSAMFVVKAASARKGKKTRKTYVPVDPTKGDGKKVKVDVYGMHYQFTVEVYVAGARKDGTPVWDKVSKIVSKGEVSNPPMYLSLETEKYEPDLATVVGRRLDGAFDQALARLASEWPHGMDSARLRALYGTMDHEQRTEFWRRARRASPVSVERPVTDLFELAIEEAKARTRTAGHAPPGHEALKFVKGWYNSSISGWNFRHKMPQWMADIKEEFSLQKRLAAGTEADAHYWEELVSEMVHGFQTQPPQTLTEKRHSLPVLAPEEVGLESLAKSAPDPALFYKAARIYTEDGRKDLKANKSYVFTKFDGVRLLRFGKKTKTLLKQKADEIDPSEIHRILLERRKYPWPGEY